MTLPRPAIWLFALALALPGAAKAVEPGEMLKDPVLEARAREISKEGGELLKRPRREAEA